MARASASIRPVAGPILTPLTAQRLVQEYSDRFPDGFTSSGESSPDSLYSDSSPTLPQHQAFEFDEFEERDIDDAAGSDGEGEGESYRRPVWGNWPEIGAANRAWASRSNTSLHGSILSVSPRGSISGVSMDRRKSSIGSTVNLRKSSLSRSLLLDNRRESESTHTGCDVNSRRRSSTKSITDLADRRRSSAGTTGSMDPLEYSRLRHVASINMLSRRFSEAIEIASPALTDEIDQPSLIRRSISEWSPYTVSSMGDDESEIHTAPFVPTPPAPRVIPAVLSNFPLASVAAEPLDPLETCSAGSSPAMRSTRERGRPIMSAVSHAQRAISTPPPPTEPAQLLRSKSRPSLKRAMTEYQFPARGANNVSTEVTPLRPALSRTNSTPFFPSTGLSSAVARELEQRAQGTFPLQRPVALGTSPLRESLRRASVASEAAARRASATSSGAHSPSRRPSVAERRISVSGGREDLRRYSFDRRMSLETRSSLAQSVSGPRKDSEGRRRISEQRFRVPAEVRRMSIESSRSASRKASFAVPMARSLTSDSRVSVGSRKSSTVSMGEYGYLAAEIDFETRNDSALPGLPPAMPALAARSSQDGANPRLRASRPASIVLPAYTFPMLSPVPGSATLTPRYNPLDSFFGRVPYHDTGSIDPLTPIPDVGSPTENVPASSGVLNRPRPISPSEYTDEGYLQRWKSTSIKAAAQLPTVPKPVSPAASPEVGMQANMPELVSDNILAAQPEHDHVEQYAEVGLIPSTNGAVQHEVPGEPVKVEDTPLIPQNVTFANTSPKESLFATRTPRISQEHQPILASPPPRSAPIPFVRPDEDVSPTSSPHLEQIPDMQTISAALATAPVAASTAMTPLHSSNSTPPITPRTSRKAVPVLTQAQLVKEHHIERELRSKSSLEQMRQAHQISLERAKPALVSSDRMISVPKEAILGPTSPRSKRRAQFVEPATRSPRASSIAPTDQAAAHRSAAETAVGHGPRPAHRRHTTMPAAPYTANGQVSAGPSIAGASGNPYNANNISRRSHVVFELPTWRSPILHDSSPEILASATLMDGQSFILPNSPDSSAPRSRMSAIRPGHSRAKSSMSTMSASPLHPSVRHLSAGGSSSAATTPALGTAIRPNMGRATSFTKFFSKAKVSSGGGSSDRKGGARPTSMDGLAISGLKYKM